MNTLLDICKRSLYMNLFIVAIPVISYMIHNGAAIQFGTYKLIFLGMNLDWLWSLPAIGRDIIFLGGMYGQVTVMLVIAYLISQILGGQNE